MVVNVDAYLERIGWSGSTAPTYATLRGLTLAHTAAIPFENFDVLLGRGIRVDLDAVQHKLVRSRRGGYCFEHVVLFAAVLDALGFEPVRHTARVVLFETRTTAPRAHMILSVPVAGRTYVVDPGFGGFVPRLPVPITATAPAEPEERIDGIGHTMVRDGRFSVLRIHTAEGEREGWVTTFDHDNHVDFEMGSHFVSTHPASPFVNNIMLQAVTPQGRTTVMNRDVKLWRDGVATPATLADRAELRGLIARDFGFDLPEIESLRVPAIPDWA